MKSIYLNALLMFSGLIVAIIFSGNASAIGVYQNFDQLPVTGEKEVPGDGGGWHYSSWKTNTKLDFNGSCGWWNENHYASPNTDLYDFFHLYRNAYNNAHMGYTSFSFLEIDGVFAVKGHSLRITTTGGIKDEGKVTVGLPLQTKEEYMEYLTKSQDPTGDQLAGSPTFYFNNNSPNNAKIAFPVAAGANRLSFYVRLPDNVNNQIRSGSDIIVSPPMEMGPGNGIGGHWYNRFYTRGGGWAHMLMDSHPNHNNAWQTAEQWPFPSLSIRDYGVDFFNNLHSLYLTTGPYGNFSIPKYDIWLDEMEYIFDPEPQNGETINNLSVLYVANGTSLEGLAAPYFEIGFHSKYKSAGLDKATYEIRYSSNPITNANWSAASPVHIQSNSFFNIVSNTAGIVKKPSDWRDGVWAAFKIASGDEARLTKGTTIYFAVKDVSQDPNNPRKPNPVYKHGRDYENNMSSLDYAGDEPALSLIKRIDFYISEDQAEQGKPIIHSIKMR